MTWADDVFGDGFLGRLWEEHAAGYIRKQCHPEDDCLEIWNYTEKCVFDRHWNPTTLATRGLITYLHDGLELSIEARPFNKFFNYGEPSAPELDLNDAVEVTDKMDGSLGIGYMAPDNRPAVATRGSFSSDQAIHATELLRSRPEYEQWTAACLEQRYTPLWEIVFPSNRIVVDYGDTDDLVFLGAVNNHLGVSHIGVLDWPGPETTLFPYQTFSEALAAPPRPGKEGMVVRKIGTELRVKLKQEDYIRLHRIVTNLNERAVWEAMKNGSTFQEFVEPLPDEFREWVKEVWDRLQDEFTGIVMSMDDDWVAIGARLGIMFANEVKDRRAFAEEAKKTRYPWMMFARLDGKEGQAAVKVWDLIKPAANQGPHGKKDEGGES